jgi:ribonuclease G
VKTVTTVCYEIFREIRREALAYKEPVLVVNCHQDVARVLQGEERQELRHLMDRYNKSIQVKAQQNYHREQFDVYGRPAQQSDRPPGATGAQAGRQERWSGQRGGQRDQERAPGERQNTNSRAERSAPSQSSSDRRGRDGAGDRGAPDGGGGRERAPATPGGSERAAAPADFPGAAPSPSEPPGRNDGGSE